jgi:hypothetical protein
MSPLSSWSKNKPRKKPARIRKQALKKTEVFFGMFDHVINRDISNYADKQYLPGSKLRIRMALTSFAASIASAYGLGTDSPWNSRNLIASLNTRGNS